MGILNNISNFFNNRKYNKLKNSYIENSKKQGYLGDITELQDFIKAKKLKLISKGKKYGDKYDIVEEIFSDNEQILNQIKTLRETEVFDKAMKMSKIFEECQYEERVVVEYPKFREIITETINFGNYYLVPDSSKSKIDLRDKFDKKLDDFKKVSDILKSIASKKRSDLDFSTNFLNPMSNTIAFFSLKELNNTEDFSKKHSIISKTKETLDGISLNNSSILDFDDISKRYSSQSTKKYFDRISSIKKLNEYGIDVSLNDDKISFIKADDTEKIEQFKETLKSKKETISPENVNARDFAMVRTTEYFPKDHEMEIVDDLNSRVYTRNFLSDKLVSDELAKKYGDDWFNIIYDGTQKGDEIAKYQKELNKKYQTLSTIYRSTKHFTLNGLVSSHEYGNFSNKPYIFIEPLEEHIKDEGLLNINEADTYFQISREKPFKLSNKSEIMMPIDEYLKVSNDPEMLKQIESFEHLTLFSGNEEMSVAMRLFEKGYIPESIGKWGYELDSVMDNAVINLSKKYDIPVSVHFYSDVKKEDDEKCIQMSNDSNKSFVDSIFEKFSIDEKYRKDALSMNLSDEDLNEIITKIGEDNLKNFISEFNENTEKLLDKKREEFYASKTLEKDSKNKADI